MNKRKPGKDFVSVAWLWRKAKDTFWELGEECYEVSLQDLYDDILGKIDLGDIGQNEDGFEDFDFEMDLRAHRESVSEFKHELESYVGKENEIPEKFRISVFEDGTIEDGNHRLVAAKLAGIRWLPTQMPE